MNLDGITIEDWLRRPPEKFLKKGGDDFPFFSKYDTLKHYLNNHLHKEVTKGAIYQELWQSTDRDKIIWLNDHGPDHIKTVIERASQLLSTEIDLTVREVFFLLNAIQIHDIGNFYGRVNHEKKVLKAINEGLTPILFDATEVRYITGIAQVHGGKVLYKDGTSDKNTIATLKRDVTSDGYTVRQQLLASILRFSDELADDRYRSDTKALNEMTLPKGSEIYHAYASCLDTVKVEHYKKTIELHFKIPKHFLTRTFGKINQDDSVIQVYLIDEIYNRAIKMHEERIYCSKFWRTNLDIENIWVQLEFYANAESDESFDTQDLVVHPDITFTLNDNQYPDISKDIYKLCGKELVYSDGTRIDGVNLKQKILQ